MTGCAARVAWGIAGVHVTEPDTGTQGANRGAHARLTTPMLWIGMIVSPGA
jgi:hypothetical protein